ncbi:MAG: phosphoribosylanthranilate isomerase [Granulosicoccus sp.]
MQHTRVKICGITRLEDALVAQHAGADAVGFVFVRKSARYIEPRKAQKIAAKLSPFVTVVGLFLNASDEEFSDAMSCLPGMLPQFHGQETADYCESRGRAYIKAIGMGGERTDDQQLSAYGSALGFLLDSNEPGSLGGTGHVFDWTHIKKDLPKPLILAGGLNVKNVGDAIMQVAPHAVDVSSGVELAKGVKCADSVQAFVKAVRTADNDRQDAARRREYKDASST